MNILELFSSSELFFLSFVGVLGLAVGSFLNVVTVRFPVMLRNDWRKQCEEFLEITPSPPHKDSFETYNLIFPRSHCPNCKHCISAFENIPILSYLLLRGRCRWCKCKIAVRYPLVELFSGVLSVMVAMYFGVTIQTLFALCLTWMLLVLSIIDIEHYILPDDIVFPGLWLGVTIAFFNVFIDLNSSILGVIFGYGSLWSVAFLFKILTNKEGMGHGDFKLLAMLGAWLGYQDLLSIIILSSFIGTIVGIGLILRGHQRSVPIPFGPYLAFSGWLCMIYGDTFLPKLIH